MPRTELPESRLINSQWFTECDGHLVLAGSRCKTCGRLYFPPKRLCPSCFILDQMETVSLSRRGKLFTFTVAEIEPPEFPTPYAFGWVDLPEGIRLFAPLVDFEPFEDKLRIGAEVELSIGPIKRDAFGVQLIGYRFRPADQEVSP